MMSRSRKSGIQQPPPEPKRNEIVLTRAAERGLASLPKTELRRVDAKIQGLAEIPRPPGVKKLEGVDDLYRIRCGDYRIVYQIEEARLVIVIVNVGNRRDIYRLL
ncbi:MAG: type II toxin-antitoxin system RelE/ParE family toxin [Isosphaeraceae bacterium]